MMRKDRKIYPAVAVITLCALLHTSPALCATSGSGQLRVALRRFNDLNVPSRFFNELGFKGFGPNGKVHRSRARTIADDTQQLLNLLLQRRFDLDANSRHARQVAREAKIRTQEVRDNQKRMLQLQRDRLRDLQQTNKRLADQRQDMMRTMLGN